MNFGLYGLSDKLNIVLVNSFFFMYYSFIENFFLVFLVSLMLEIFLLVMNKGEDVFK